MNLAKLKKNIKVFFKNKLFFIDNFILFFDISQLNNPKIYFYHKNFDFFSVLELGFLHTNKKQYIILQN